MPRKSIREMSALQRGSRSLRAKMIYIIAALGVIISVAAVGFGFYLYNSAVRRENRMTTWHLSKAAAWLIDISEASKEARIVIETYDAMTEEERANQDSREYLNQFVKVEDAGFQTIRQVIHALQEETGAIAAYTAALDTENNRMIFIADGDQSSTFCPPGKWDQMEADQISAFVNGAPVSSLDRLYGMQSIPSIDVDMEPYGYRCTAGTMLFEYKGYPVFIFYDTDMAHIIEISRTFLLQYILLLVFVTGAAGILIITRMHKYVVKPINSLAEAAKAYTRAKKEDRRGEKYFEDLGIHTGDEIENLSLTMKDMERDLSDYVEDLTRVTADKEKIKTELSVASRIQEGMIPHIFPPFPDRSEFDIYAAMRTAKEVGGDFYDFFLIDEDHLGLVMADVSGKGIPAALFMMASKILIKNIAAIRKTSPAEVLAEVNRAICANNSAEMFVTVWLGFLEISTGLLRAANAGHEYPALRKADGSFALYKDKHGFIIGGMEDMVYTDYEIQLKPGDVIFEYTDGVTEATDEQDGLFGTDRMLEALNRDPDAPVEALLERVIDEIDDFVGAAPQFDDITMLCLRYYGPGGRPGKDPGTETETGTETDSGTETE